MASGWWDNNGAISGCIVAYQPVGAASLAASYSNLVNPGTNNAGVGSAPSFNTSTGWGFNGSTQYLTTDLSAANVQAVTVIIRYSSLGASGVVFGIYGPSAWLLLQETGTIMRSYNGNSLLYADNSPVFSGGVYAIAGRTPYRNGSAETHTISAGGVTAVGTIFIGALSNNAGGPAFFAQMNVQAFAAYNNDIGASAVATVTTAMAALPVASIFPTPIYAAQLAAYGG